MGILKKLCFIGLAASSTLAIALPSDNAVLEKKENPCNNGPGWAKPISFVGSDTTTGRHCETQFGYDYTPITGIEVWRKGNKHGTRIAGLRFTYASGSISPTYGHQDTSTYKSENLKLNPGETITTAILYGDGKGKWLGHIYLETSGGQKWNSGRDTKKITPYGVNVGSGILLGAIVTAQKPDKDSPEDIASLALLFLGQPVDHISVDNINFAEDPSGSNSGIESKNVVVGQWFNHDNNTVNYSLSPSYSVASSYSYSQTSLTSYGASVSIEMSAEMFDIGAKNTDQFSWEKSDEKATTSATSSATSITCAATGTLKPNQGVKVTGIYHTGKGTWNYDSSVTVHLKGGSEYHYTEKGLLTDVKYKDCNTTWESVKDPSIPNSPGVHMLKRGPKPTSRPILGL